MERLLAGLCVLDKSDIPGLVFGLLVLMLLAVPMILNIIFEIKENIQMKKQTKKELDEILLFNSIRFCSGSNMMAGMVLKTLANELGIERFADLYKRFGKYDTADGLYAMYWDIKGFGIKTADVIFKACNLDLDAMSFLGQLTEKKSHDYLVENAPKKKPVKKSRKKKVEE